MNEELRLPGRSVAQCRNGDYIGCTIGSERRICRDCEFVNTAACSIFFLIIAHQQNLNGVNEPEERLEIELSPMAVRFENSVFEVQLEVLDPGACPACQASKRELDNLFGKGQAATT